MFELDLFSDDETTQPILLPLKDAEIYYYRNFLEESFASEAFSSLMSNTPWREDEIKVFGKTYMQPRLTALYGEAGKSYTYSGLKMNPIPFTSLLNEIRGRVELAADHHFTTVLLNLYRNGADSNGWHSDDEKELGVNPVIASISLGANRYFHLKHKNEKTLRRKVLLKHGSLLLMKGATQHHWLHQLPKTKRVQEPRINLTFRTIFSI